MALPVLKFGPFVHRIVIYLPVYSKNLIYLSFIRLRIHTQTVLIFLYGAFSALLLLKVFIAQNFSVQTYTWIQEFLKCSQ
jgi:hypothetical protein